MHIMRILIGWEETSRLYLSFNKVSWGLITAQKHSCFTLSVETLQNKVKNSGDENKSSLL